MIPVGMRCVPGGIGEADLGPLLRKGLWHPSSLFLSLICMIPIGMGCLPDGVGEVDHSPLLMTGLWYLSALFLTPA
jgi:hypothetical protein